MQIPCSSQDGWRSKNYMRLFQLRAMNLGNPPDAPVFSGKFAVPGTRSCRGYQELSFRRASKASKEESAVTRSGCPISRAYCAREVGILTPKHHHKLPSKALSS